MAYNLVYMAYNSDYLDIFFIVFWLFVFFITFLTEIKLRQYSLIVFSISAIIAAICGLIFASALYQCLIFISASVLSGIIFNPLRKRTKIKRIFDNQICTFIGRDAIVTKTIEPDALGEISFYDIKWEAMSNCDYPIKEGEEVSIIGKGDIYLVVSKIKH